MKILIVFAHPEPKSFNGALYRTAVETLQEQGHEVKTSDLYQMNFNPVSDRSNFTTVKDHSFLKLGMEEIYATEHDGFAADIHTEQEKLEWCDLLIWQFPLWWFSVPAILKGWTDRAFAAGKIYGAGRIPYVSGKFKGKKALLSLTTGSSESYYAKDGDYGDINGILKPIHRGILEYVGFSVLQPQLNYEVAHLTDAERKVLLQKWSERLKTIFEEEEMQVGKY
ncbi:MAG TPA: flavodoxin family protein [Porphyromonadaceae bacterium]|jgi:NAD(P)H dehydrogenase (quinone)|nr:flavodoxin family protein [Porphyromonadaceae bacterium]HCM20231.1 flavodoxin family protein [Porphyromonadaceae bacterium]